MKRLLALLFSLTLCSPAFAQYTSGIPPATLPAIAADSLVGNASGSSAVPTGVPLTNCAGGSNALNYSTSTHLFTCLSIPGSGAGLSANTFTDTQTIAEGTNGNIPLVVSGGCGGGSSSCSVQGSGTNQVGLKVTGTLNTTGVIDGAVLFGNITNTSCNGNTTCFLEDLQVAGSSKFKVDMTGAVTSVAAWTGTNVNLGSTNAVIWNSRGRITSHGTNNLQIGDVDASSVVGQSLSMQSVVAGNGNTAAADFTIVGSRSNGSGAPGKIIFQTAPAIAASGSQNAPATLLTMDGNLHLITGGAAPALTSCGGSPTIAGTDISGTITEGSVATGCIWTPAIAYAARPHCTLSSEAGLAFSYTVGSTGVITIINIGALSSTLIDYVCLG